MHFQANRIRQLWFPFAILAIIVLTIGWILAGVIYPSAVQGNVLDPTPTNTTTSTATSTNFPTPTKTTEPTATDTPLPPTETSPANCTYSIYYWGTNVDAWQIENIVIGNLSFTKAEAIKILTKEEPKPTEHLMGQFFTALLNNLNGADPTEIDATMITVRDWLVLNPHRIDLTETELQDIQMYTEDLRDFNLGIVGPGSCSDELPTPTYAATKTPTPTATPTQGTFIPFFTPTPTKGKSGRPKPTTIEPSPEPPTNTPQPKPTDTPISTPTSVIPPTDTPTSPPPTPPPTQPPATTSPLPPTSTNTPPTPDSTP